METDDEPGINAGRAYACEFVAWRFVLHLSDREAIDLLLTELPLDRSVSLNGDEESGLGLLHSSRDEPSTPRPKHVRIPSSSYANTPPSRIIRSPGLEDVPTGITATENDLGHSDSSGYAAYFDSLNALEIAAVSGAKKFLSQRVVQKIIEKIWRGDIVFWETLDVDSVKQAKVYNKKSANSA